MFDDCRSEAAIMSSMILHRDSRIEHQRMRRRAASGYATAGAKLIPLKYGLFTAVFACEVSGFDEGVPDSHAAQGYTYQPSKPIIP